MRQETKFNSKRLSLLSSTAFAALSVAASPAPCAQAVAAGAKDEYNPTEISKGIHGNWPKQVRALGLSRDKSYIIILLSPPKTPMDLSSAERFRQTLNGTFIFGDIDIGHAMVGWQCQNPSGQPIRGFTGMSGEDSDQSKKMIRGGWGATTFLSTFTDGYLQDSEDIEDGIDEDLTKDQKRLEVAAIEVAAEDCMKTETFLQAFLEHENRPATRFGLVPKPQNFEGGGCGSFAVAMSDQTGVWPSVSALFWRELKVPKSLMGWRKTLPEDTEAPWLWPNRSKNIGGTFDIDVPLDVFRGTSWEPKRGLPSTSLSLVDPELMLLTVRTLKKIANKEAKSRIPRARLAPIDKRIARLAVPFGASDGEHPATQYYYRWVELNANHDPQSAKLVKAVKAWWQEKAKDGFSIRPLNKRGLLGVAIEKTERQ